MNPGKAFFAWTQANVTLKALVGDRVEPNENYQTDIRPRITYQVISTRRLVCLKNSLLARLTRYRLQVNMYATTYDQCNAMQEAINDIHGYRGMLASNDVQDVQIDDGHESRGDQGAAVRQLPEASMDLMFWIGA